MNEELKQGKQVNAEKPPHLRSAQKYLRSFILAASLIGNGSLDAKAAGWEKDRGEPVLEFIIPSEGGWEKIGGELEKYNIWTSEKAREFFMKNQVRLDAGPFAAAKDYFGTLRGVKMDTSSFYENTLVIYYFNKDGKSVKCVQLHPTKDGKFERREFDY